MTYKIYEIRVKNPKSLNVYDKFLELNKLVYQLVKQFPWIEEKNMKLQMIRCCTSIGANLCEGNGQIYQAKELSSLNVSLGSAQELRYFLDTSLQLEYINSQQFRQADELTSVIIKILITMMKKLKSNEVA